MLIWEKIIKLGDLAKFIWEDWTSIEYALSILVHWKVMRLWGHLSIVEDYYKLVGHVLIKEAKTDILTRGKTTKVKENSTRQRQQ